MNKLVLQSTCFENIKSLCTNYKKDSIARKTTEYLNKRLSSLEEQWMDFNARHTLLLQELEDKNIAYFTEDVYGKTRAMFESTKADMLRLLQSSTENVKFDLTGVLEEDTDEKITVLLTKQECNFKAIDRAMSKIDLKTMVEKWELEDHLSILKSKWETIDKTHWELEAFLKGANDTYYDMFVNIEAKYDEIRRQLNSKIWSTAHHQRSAPRIEIPEFSGQYSQWISFKDLFLETIHNNPTLNKAEKMQHLKAKLRGEAEKLVQHLSISNDHYISCWEILSQRYDNRRLQFTSFMNTMLQLPAIQRPDANNLKRLHDVITECLNGLTNIGIDISTWDPIIVHLMSQKLDSNTHSDYIKEASDNRELPLLSEFLTFLENTFLAFETMKPTKKEAHIPEKAAAEKYWPRRSQDHKKFYPKTYHTAFGHYPLCKNDHVLMQCPQFIDLDTVQRNKTVAKLRLCKNCLYSHDSQPCNSTKTCKECNMKHHTLLHYNNTKKSMSFPGNERQRSGQRPGQVSNNSTSNHLSTNDEMEVLLTTVQLQVKSVDGTFVTLRALLDQGSQVNLITENAAQRLRLQRKKLNATISGVGSVSGDCKGRLELSCKSIHSEYEFDIEALIMKKLINKLPTRSFEKPNWSHLDNLKLADPDYNISRSVDLLLGANVYAEIILDGILRGAHNSPIAQHTQLGWILCGKIANYNCHATIIELEDMVKFWECEDVTQNCSDVPQDDYCETYYRQTTRRSSDGRYIVKMPLCPDYEKKLGKSKQIAVSQLLQLEKRFQRNSRLEYLYKDFLKEYLELNHMKPAISSPSSSLDCYLPHHGVLKEQSESTKLRVVFNGSQKTSTGYSLNNLLEKGPNLQQDIQQIILKWRTYKYAFTADIEKMYRCILLSEEQQKLQQIVWRSSPSENVQDFQLCTVTYGTKCAPWLALRTIKQLAYDDGQKYPTAAKVLLEETYVDDVISGHNSLLKAQELQQSLIELLKGAGMNLRKWSSSHPGLLENLSDNQISNKLVFDFKEEESMKTLGLGWNPKSDTFLFNWRTGENKEQATTKRMLLSQISKLYDPLGWLSPVTILAKLLFQEVWTNHLGWDEELPPHISQQWLKLRADLPCIKTIKLKRWIGCTQNKIELFGFCDASEKAYSCVVYSRILNEQSTKPTITLLAAKTRVAPLSQKITLPKLELCGALLLSHLMSKIKKALNGMETPVHAWCDSQVVLAWLQGEPSKRERYVANRVAKITQIIPAEEWRYIRSQDNPADCASRGLLPSKLQHFQLWWEGPALLTNFGTPQHEENTVTCAFTTNIGNVCQVSLNSTAKENNNFVHDLLNRCSTLTLLHRIVAWIQRFITSARNKTN